MTRQSYTITDFYKSYKNYIIPNSPYDIDYTTFRAILSDYFKYIRDEIMDECKEYKLPCRLGTLQIIKKLPKEFSSKSLCWDWKSTRELGKPVYCLNEHSGYYKYRFFWSKQNCILPYLGKYMFIACRANKRKLAQIIKNNLKDYPEVS